VSSTAQYARGLIRSLLLTLAAGAGDLFTIVAIFGVPIGEAKTQSETVYPGVDTSNGDILPSLSDFSAFFPPSHCAGVLFATLGGPHRRRNSQPEGSSFAPGALTLGFRREILSPSERLVF
jgi:hypothetical protein